MLASRTLLLSLVGLTLACGPDSGASATDTETSSGTQPGPTTGGAEPTTGGAEPTTGDMDTDTTGAPVFPTCQEPMGPDNVGFELSGDLVVTGAGIDLVCTIVFSETAPDFTASIALSCLDEMNLQQQATIDFQLFSEANLGVLDGVAEVRLLHRVVADFEQREVLALRGLEDDSLLLFAARGYEIFAIEDKTWWAPLAINPVAEALCPTDGDCDTITRTALDITLGEVTERVFDHNWIEFAAPGPSVHIGLAQIVDHYAGDPDQCSPGDAPEGLETILVVIAEK